MTDNALEDRIMNAVREIVARKHPHVEDIQRDQRLINDLGLRSLDLAELVARLDVELDLDPFSTMATIADVRTVGDLCDAYVQCQDVSQT